MLFYGELIDLGVKVSRTKRDKERWETKQKSWRDFNNWSMYEDAVYKSYSLGSKTKREHNRINRAKVKHEMRSGNYDSLPRFKKDLKLFLWCDYY